MIEIIRGEDIDAYHANEALSKTKLWDWQEMTATEWKATYIDKLHRKDASHYRVGRCLDALVFPDGGFENKYTCEPSHYENPKTKKAVKWNNNAAVCEEWHQNNRGKTILSFKEMKMVQAMHSTYLRAKAKSKTLATIMDGEAQVSMRGYIPGCGLLQSRPDLINFEMGWSVDLKSARSIYSHSRDFVSMGYHVQVGLVDLLSEAAGHKIHDHYHLVIEKSMYPRIKLFRIPDDMIDYGKKMAKKLAIDIQKAVKSNFEEPEIDLEDLIVPEWVQKRVVAGEELKAQQFFGDADSTDWAAIVTGD